MKDNAGIYSQISTILSQLDSELEKVANRDDILSENEINFIQQVKNRIPEIGDELRHIFEDDNVTEEEKLLLYRHLGKLMDDSVAFTRIDDRIDEEEIFLITKLKVQLQDIVNQLKDAEGDKF